MKEMADVLAIRSYFQGNNLPYFTFYLRSHKAIQAVILHLPSTTSVEDISDGLLDFGFDVISVKQISVTRRSLAEGIFTANIPLFLITFPRKSKFHEIFKVTSLAILESG
jgi:hypothetical protein